MATDRLTHTKKKALKNKVSIPNSNPQCISRWQRGESSKEGGNPG